MDGTFLRDDRNYDKARLREILKEFERRNLIFCAASGRQLLALEELFNEFQEQIAFCAENGALVKYKGEIIFTEAIGNQRAEQLFGLLHENPYMQEGAVLFSGLKGAYALDTADPDFVDFASLYYKHMQTVPSLDKIDDTILKVCAEFPPENIRACEDWINERMPGIRATTTGFRSVDIMTAGISKATGLSHLLSHFNLTPEQLLAFGDQMNDYEMLELAGHAVAVSNAVPEILSISDQVIGSNDSNAVLTELESFLSN